MVETRAHTGAASVDLDGASYRMDTGHMTKEHEMHAIELVIDRLSTRFPDVARTDIEVVVYEEHGKLNAGQIRDYVPVLVERSSKLRLAHEWP